MAATALSLLTRDEVLFARLRAAAGRRAVHRLAQIGDLNNLPAGSLVMVDTAMSGLPPFSDPRWRVWCGHLSIVILSSAPGDEEGLAALDVGASGYCHAYAAAETLAQVIDVVASGELWVGRTLMGRLIGGMHRALNTPAAVSDWTAGLTEREIEVARLAATGEANASIATRLGITERTVKAHLTAIFEKLGVADRLQLALRVHGIR